MGLTTAKFEDKVFREAFLKYVEMGLLPYRAAVLCGITMKTYYLWERYRKDDEEAGLDENSSKVIKFFNEIEQARQKNVAYHLNNITHIAKKGNWTASAWVLERLHGGEFRKVDNINIENDSIKIVGSMPTHESED